MALLLQVLGVLAAGVAVSAIARGRLGERRLDPKPVAVVAAIAGCAVFASQVLSESEAFVEQRGDLNGLSAERAERLIGKANGQNVEFLDWAADRMGPGDTYSILPADLPTRVDRFIPYQWSAFQLSPRRSVGEDDADWLLFYGVAPEDADYDRSRFAAPEEYGPRYALARRAGADAG